MGRILLVARLAAHDLRRRPAQALLLLLVITSAMATLTLGLILHGVTARPYVQTRAATAGPDVVASSVGFPGWPGTAAGAPARLAALARAPGVAAHSGPFPVAWPVLRAHGITAYAMAEGRGPAPALVDQPEVTQGTWVRARGVVVERAFAVALGVRVGDRLTLNGRPFRVAGIAVTAAVPVYSQVCFYGGCSGPGGQPRSFDTGLVWLTPAAARSLAAAGDPLSYYLNLRLRNPAAAPAFVRAHQPPAGPGPSPLTAWPSLREAAGTLVAQEQQVLMPASWLIRAPPGSAKSCSASRPAPSCTPPCRTGARRAARRPGGCSPWWPACCSPWRASRPSPPGSAPAARSPRSSGPRPASGSGRPWAMVEGLGKRPDEWQDIRYALPDPRTGHRRA